MWNVPNDLASLQWQRQQHLQRRWFGLWWQGLRELLALPFDLARHLHAAGVKAGALPRSLLESQRFEQRLGQMENLSLGPLARQL